MQVATNLVSNAVTYTRHGSVTARLSADSSVAASGHDETRLYELEVSDTGIGIDGQPGTGVSAAQGARDGARISSGRVLLCEDEAINRLYLTTHLESLGYEVDVAADGLEAVERICSNEASGGRSSVPIVALTAHTNAADLRKCHDVGMNGFVSKPISEAELGKALEEWIR